MSQQTTHGHHLLQLPVWTGTYHKKFLGPVSFSIVLGQEGVPFDVMCIEAPVTVEECTVIAMSLLLTCTDKHIFSNAKLEESEASWP